MTTLQLPTPLVDVAWLAAHLADPRLVVLDAHMAPPGSAPVAGPVMQIPGARRFDFDSDIRDPTFRTRFMNKSAGIEGRERR